MTHHTLAERHLSFETVTRDGFCWLQSGIGAKKSVIIMHGVTGGKDDMLPLAERYLALGYAVYCPDLIGHGDSEMIAVREFDDLGRWFRDLIQTIGVTPDLIVSNSYSSGVVYNYIALGFLPEKTRVILACPTPTIAFMSRALNRFGQMLPDRAAWFAYNLTPAQRLRVKVLYRGHDRASYDWLVESEKRKFTYISPEVSPTLTNLLVRDNPFAGAVLPDDIQRRVTVVLGERDNVVTRGTKRFLEQKLPHATFVSAGAVGHILHFEAIDALVDRRNEMV